MDNKEHIMMDYVNTWGLYQCFQGTDDALIDSDNREEFFKLQPNGKVFQCIAMDKRMLTLKYGERLFRVNPKLYRMVKKPLYEVGDKVEIIEKTLFGEIVDVNWHIKENVPFYYVEIEGKKAGKRFKDCDLRKVN